MSNTDYFDSIETQTLKDKGIMKKSPNLILSTYSIKYDEGEVEGRDPSTPIKKEVN